MKDSVPRDHNYCNSKKQKSKLIDCNPSVEKGIILVKDKDFLGVKRIHTEVCIFFYQCLLFTEVMRIIVVTPNI